MKSKNLLMTTAVAALAFPAGAAADKPDDKPAKPAKPAKTKSVGFSVGGVDLSGLTVTDGKLSGPLTLDPTSANKHARTFLKLTKADLKGEKTVQLGTAADAVIVKFNGLKAGDALLATDRVKLSGKLSGATLDIRKITVTRGETETDTETEAPKPTTTTSSSKSAKKSESSKTAPGYVCRNESKKKAEGQKKSAFAQCVAKQRKAKQQS